MNTIYLASIPKIIIRHVTILVILIFIVTGNTNLIEFCYFANDLFKITFIILRFPYTIHIIVVTKFK